MTAPDQNPSAPEKSILLYRFLDASAALKTIESRKLKVGRILEFNDPFEWRPGITNTIPAGQMVVESVMDRFVSDMNSKIGIICMSSSAKEPVLWSHYADNHHGVALEFDYLTEKGDLSEVRYSDKRPIIDANRLHDETHLRETLKPMIDQKSTGWSYEKEYRVHVNLQDCDIANGLYFKAIPDGFLTRVILGYRCPLEASYLRKALDAVGLTDTEVIRAKMDQLSYSVII
ncbi:MAG: DUF2971 domain-containing protein [Verrucomicrobiales bacterium]